MSKLTDFIWEHACANTATAQDGSDVIFFKVVAVKDPVLDDLVAALREHKGEFCEVDVFDGKEHNYLELGGWLGSQDYALRLIGLGAEMGLWHLLTPKTMLGDLISDDIVQSMAGMGMIALQYKQVA